MQYDHEEETPRGYPSRALRFAQGPLGGVDLFRLRGIHEQVTGPSSLCLCDGEIWNPGASRGGSLREAPFLAAQIGSDSAASVARVSCGRRSVSSISRLTTYRTRAGKWHGWTLTSSSRTLVGRWRLRISWTISPSFNHSTRRSGSRKGPRLFRGRGIAWPGFAAVAHNHPGLFLSGDFDRHGHSGYAWAARKDLIQEHGLYDRSIAGSGDHLMAHAMMGDLSSPCVTNSVGAANPFRDSFHAWAKPFHRDVRSRVGFVRGAVLHRWHGDRKKRGYYKRMVGLLARDYNPSLDVRVASSGALEWTEHGAALGRWLKDYFTRRQEDGKPGPVERIPWSYLEGLRRDAPGRLDEEIRPFAPLLGPLATLVAERSEDWIGAGLTPVLPNLVAAMILISSSKSTELTELLPTTEALGAKDNVRGYGLKSFGLFASLDASKATFSGKSRISGELTFAAVPGHSRLLDASGPLVRRGRKEVVDSFETANSILEEILRAAKQFEEMIPSQWKQMTPGGRWAALSGVSEWRFVPLSEQLKARIRDPRWSDAPELKAASRKLRNRRARLARHESPTRNPYDAVVGPGSAVDGLDHV